jgi:adaptin ear-binding coat-associated protein 1/2
MRPTAVYKIPPLKANEGHRAQEWGDLSQPLWKGRMRIVEKSNTVALLFEDSQTGTKSSTFSTLLIDDPSD